MVDAVNAWQLGIFDETGRNDPAKLGGQKLENQPTLGAIIVHSSCWPVWHLQSQDAKFDDRLHEENGAANHLMRSSEFGMRSGEFGFRFSSFGFRHPSRI